MMLKKKYLLTVAALVFLTISHSAVVSGEEVDVEYGPMASSLPSNGELRGWMDEIWEMGAKSEAGFRRIGTAGDHEAEIYIAQRFLELGLQDVHLEPIEITVWEPLAWGFSVQTASGNESFSPSPLEYSASTGPSGLEGELVYVGEGTEQDFIENDVAGKIAVVDIRMPYVPIAIERPTAYLTYDPHNTLQGWGQLVSGLRLNFQASFNRAVSHGAVGFVGILKDLQASIKDHFGPYDGVLRPIPGLWLGSEDGTRLRNMLTEESLVGRILLDASVSPGVTNNVIGLLPGTTEKIILVESHHDGWAINDASAMAVVLGLADYLTQFPQESREKTLMFVATGRFHGGVGAEEFVERHQDLIPDIVTTLAIEHIGKEYVEIGGELVDTGLVSPRILWVSPNEHLVSFTTEAVVQYDLRRTLVEPAGGDALSRRAPPFAPIGESHSWYLAGVPVVAYFSWPTHTFRVYHDTPDKVAVDQLRPITAAFAKIIENIDDTPATLLVGP